MWAEVRGKEVISRVATFRGGVGELGELTGAMGNQHKN
jgi:hypothetical protein